MHQITVRGLDIDVEKKIRKIAKQSRKSINQVIKETIHKEFKKTRDKPASSLKRLAGGWSPKEAAAFEKAFESCEQIDAEMWK